MTDSNTKTQTDKPLTRSEVRQAGTKVREYTADGILYAYRDGDEHIVVSHGREPPTQWSETVPAERHTVLAGEHLWTIPDNWQHRININGVGVTRYGIYTVPETGVDVLVQVPRKCHLVDAWYSVVRVGELNVTYDDEIAWDELEQTIAHREDDDTISTEALDALKQLYQRRHKFESEFAEAVGEYADLFKAGKRREPVTVRNWNAEPWTQPFHNKFHLKRFLDIDEETRKAVVESLSHGSVIPNYPTVRVDVDEDVTLPDGYAVRALVEAGASGAETTDYLVTEYHNLMNQTEWAEVCGKTASAVNKNVRRAEAILSD